MSSKNSTRLFTADNFTKHIRAIVVAVVLLISIIAWQALPVHRRDLTVHFQASTTFNLPKPEQDEPLVLEFRDVTASEACLLDVDLVNYGKEAIDEESWSLNLSGSSEAIALLNSSDLPAAVVRNVSHDSNDQLTLSLGVVNRKKRLPLKLLLMNPADNSTCNLNATLSKEIADLSDPELLEGSLFWRYAPQSFSSVAMLSFVPLFVFLASLVYSHDGDSTSERCVSYLFSFLTSLAACVVVGAILGAVIAFGAALYYGGWAAM